MNILGSLTVFIDRGPGSLFQDDVVFDRIEEEFACVGEVVPVIGLLDDCGSHFKVQLDGAPDVVLEHIHECVEYLLLACCAGPLHRSFSSVVVYYEETVPEEVVAFWAHYNIAVWYGSAPDTAVIVRPDIAIGRCGLYIDSVMLYQLKSMIAAARALRIFLES